MLHSSLHHSTARTLTALAKVQTSPHVCQIIVFFSALSVFSQMLSAGPCTLIKPNTAHLDHSALSGGALCIIISNQAYTYSRMSLLAGSAGSFCPSCMSLRSSLVSRFLNTSIISVMLPGPVLASSVVVVLKACLYSL